MNIIDELAQVEKLTERNREIRKQIYDATTHDGLQPVYIEPPVLGCGEPKDTAAWLLNENAALELRLEAEKEAVAALKKDLDRSMNPEFL